MNKQRFGLVLAFTSASLVASGISIAEEETKPAAEKAAAPTPQPVKPTAAHGGPGGQASPGAGGAPHGGPMARPNDGPGGPGRPLVGPDGKPLLRGPGGLAGPHGFGGPGGPGSFGGPPGGPGSEERSKQLKERIAKLKSEGKVDQATQLERMLANGPGAGPRPPMTPEEIKKRRQTRKLARIRMMHRRYGEALLRPELKAEVTTHAKRTARLARLRTLVQAKPEAPERDKQLQRINQLMGLENSRHNKHMADLAPESVRGTANANALAPGRLPQPGQPAEKRPAAEDKNDNGEAK